MKNIHILKGCHFSTFLPRIIKTNELFKKSIKIKFDESCKYIIDEHSCVNKLWGFCNGLFGVHKDSWRFGWTYDINEDKINIWVYIYNSGKLTKKIIYKLDFDKEYELTIEFKKFDKTSYLINFNINSELISQYYISEFKMKKYLLELGFYFGGKSKAPHNIRIDFNRIY